MAIVESLLIAAPVLQDYLVDKTTGAPLSAGIIKCYKDNGATTFKNWYYQTGSNGNYSWIALDNPLTLSAVGTIQDPDGNDVIPFFYPYSEDDSNTREPYRIEVYANNGSGGAGVLQFTRYNFPYVPNTSGDTVINPTWRNYIVNNRFWRNQGTVTTTPNTIVSDGTTFNYSVLAPSQHDGFSMPDMLYMRTANDATDQITFNVFSTSDVLDNDITPEYYMNVKCTVAGSDTIKMIQIPISLHVKTLSSVECSVCIQAQANSVDPDNDITLKFLQYTGTGASASSSNPTIQEITLNNSWQKWVIPTVTPSADSLTSGTLGSGKDDALYLQIHFPAAATFDVNIALPSIYLSNDVPDNDFDTYDQIDAVTNSPRTGDIRKSLNSFQPFGWVLCNDGVISNSGSITPPSNIPVARANADAWPLFNLLWSQTNIAVCPIYDSAGASSTKGATAIADWVANKQMQLSLTLGRSLIGLPPAMNVTYDRATTPSWSSTAGVFTATSTTLLYVGAPIYLTGTMPASGNFTANTVYYAIPAIDGSSTTQFQLATTYANAIAGTAIAAGGASNNGSSIVVNFALGGAFGQSRHIQLERELATHNHPGSFLRYFTAGVAPKSVSVVNQNTTEGTITNDLVIANDGNSYPFNIIPPSVYMNVFLKL